jgi:hypothetical protein
MTGTFIYKQACLVEIAPTTTWRKLLDSTQAAEGELTSSASGILFFLESAYVLTHSSILLSHFSNNKRVAKVLKKSYLNKNYFLELKALVTVQHECKQDLSIYNQKENNAGYTKALFSATSSSSKMKQEQYSGNIECMWKAEQFAKTIQSFLPASENWSFFEEPAQHSSNSSDTDPKMIAELLPRFVLIKLDNSPKFLSCARIHSDRLAIGDTVHMVGTPFGAMSPSVFLNSVSAGIVCNVAGSNQELIVTDARCIPGTEGGPLYLGDAKQK